MHSVDSTCYFALQMSIWGIIQFVREENMRYGLGETLDANSIEILLVLLLH